ncbi:MAG: hypothetical protein LBU09_04655 [Endomicrobium sp.]|jgi:hypothetical protein|nr:hypothetical protein [Endomicrobium sp.]
MENFKLDMFENFNVRRIYDEKREKWYFSIINIVAVLTEQNDYQKARDYWNKLAQRLRDEGGKFTKDAKEKFEKRTGKKVITNDNFCQTPIINSSRIKNNAKSGVQQLKNL